MTQRNKKKPIDPYESKSFHGNTKYQEEEEDVIPPLSRIQNHDDWIGTLTEAPHKSKKMELNQFEELDFQSQQD